MIAVTEAFLPIPWTQKMTGAGSPEFPGDPAPARLDHELRMT